MMLFSRTISSLFNVLLEQTTTIGQLSGENRAIFERHLGDCRATIGRLSNDCRAIVERRSGDFRAIIGRLYGTTVGRLSGDCRTTVTWLLGDCRATYGRLSGNYRATVGRLSDDCLTTIGRQDVVRTLAHICTCSYPAWWSGLPNGYWTVYMCVCVFVSHA